jgi:hypothetical protein
MCRSAVKPSDAAAPGRSSSACLAAFAALLILVAASPALAQLGEVEVGPLRLVYFEGTESFLVPHAARSFLRSMAFQRRLFGFEPAEPVNVLLADFSDAGNAGASVIPRDGLTIEIAPLSYAFETLAANERMITIMNHELVHVATMDMAAGRDRLFRGLFRGKVAPIADHPESILFFYLTAPRVATPRWYHEGLAVFTDTWMAGGIGRAQGGWDEMVFRAMVRDGALFYDPLGLASEGTKIDFQLQINSYLYGGRFMTWLVHRYSADQMVAWASRTAGSRAYYASQFKAVFGRSIEDAWAEWIAFEKDFQLKNLAAIRRYPTTPSRDLSRRALGSVSRAYFDQTTGTIYAGFNYPGVVAHLGAIKAGSGSIERILDIKGPIIYTVTSLAWDPDSRTLFYTTDNSALRDIVSVDPATGRHRVLLKDARIGDLAFDRADRSLWGIRHLNGIATLVRIPAPYSQWNQVFSFPYGVVPYDLDISPDGRRLAASFGEIDGQQTVRLIDVDRLLKGDATPAAQFDFGSSVPSNFVFSPDGRFLYGSAYFTGVSNIFRYEIATKKVEAVTNAETGFFRPIPLGGDDLIVFRYSGEGFVPTRITAAPQKDLGSITFLGERVIAEQPALKEWNVLGGPPIDFDRMEKRTGKYRLAGGLRLESLYPVVEGYKDTQAVGVRVNLSDPLQLNRLGLSASYSPGGNLRSSERLHLRADYERYDWRMRAELNKADFYDLVGPTKTGRKGYVFGIGHKTSLIYDEPRRLDLRVDGSVSGNLDRIPAYQNIEVDVTNLVSLQARLTYSNARGSLGRVDDEKGDLASLVVGGDHVDGKTVVGLYGTFDHGFALPLGHSSVWIRSAAGLSPNDANNRFANFYFGGFGNNWVDRGEEKRYREFYGFPGADLNEIGGRNFVKSTLEWNLPPWRFRRVGTPGFYVSWMRPAVFAGALATNLDAPGVRRVATDLGAQLDFRFTVLSALDMTVSVGGAVAFENGHTPRREAMVSLRVLR